MNTQFFQRSHRNRGQGLAEFAVTLPLLLLVLAGLLEVANLLVIYSRMETLAREASRFGALGGTDIGVRDVFVQSARDTMELSPGVVEVWIARPVLKYDGAKYYWEGDVPSGNPPGMWGSTKEQCVYPEENCGASGSQIDPKAVLGRISQSGATVPAASGDRFVVVAVYYEAKTILNLPFFKVASGETGRVPLHTYAIYRQEIAQTTVNMLGGGCSSYPIMMSTNVAGLDPSKSNRAVEGQKLTLARNASTRDFDFLAWRIADRSATALNKSMEYPGNSNDPDYGYIDAYDNQTDPAHDISLNMGDYVASADTNAWIDATLMEKFIKPDKAGFQRTLRVILTNGSLYAGSAYQIQGFAVVRVSKYTVNSASDQSLEIKFLRFDVSCGESEGGS